MIVTPGPYAPTVTQWVPKPEDQWDTDAYGNKVPTFNGRPVRVLASYPGASLETDNAAQDEVTADVVLLLQPTTVATAADEWTVTDGLRYRTVGAPGRFLHPATGTAVTQVNLRRIT
jgi:hypothetical protein